MPARQRSITMTTEAALYRLMTWLGPGYPLGAFSYSHGLEYAIEARLVIDRETLRHWVETVMTAAAGRSDGALLAAAWHAAKHDDAASLDEIIALAAAWRGTAETALESRAQGAAFLATTRAAWPHRRLDEIALRHQGALALPAAVGIAAALHGIALAATLTAYFHAFAANLVSAGVRLVPLGQSDGQRIIAELEAPIAAAAERVMATPLDAVGTAAPLVDWCSMQHETQYTRLFRS
jgi:urease accessory protein